MPGAAAPNEAGKAWSAIVIGLFIAFGGVLYGYDIGNISGILVMPYWREHFTHTSDHTLPGSQSSLIVSILSVGTFFGALAAAPCGDILGRRLGLVISVGIVFNLGVILQVAATAQPLFIIGRFFAGFGVGLLSALIPLYQSETAPKWIRGTIVGAYQLAIAIGIFLAMIVDNGTKNRQDSGSYRIPVGIQFLWAVILVIGVILLPETPRYLIKIGKFDKAAQSLGTLRRLPANHPAVIEELNEIKANHVYELSLGTSSYAQCFRGTLGKRLLTGCGVQCLQQLSGVNFIFYYRTSYFQNAGFQNPFLTEVITGCVMVVATFPSLYMIEKLGRRKLLILGAAGMCVCQYIAAMVATLSNTSNQASQKTLIAFVCLNISLFACTLGPASWVITGELFSLQARAKCLSMTTASNWFMNWLLAFTVSYLVDKDHANLGSKVFFIWASCCLIAVFFFFFMVYETKGLTLEQVDELYNNVDKAWKSQDYRNQMSSGTVDREEPDTPHEVLTSILQEANTKSAGSVPPLTPTELYVKA